MKELSIEQKARAYDEAIERANELNYVSDKDSLQRKTVEHIFPELKESENEKIRSALLRGFNSMYANQAVPTFAGVHIKDILTWLEKQGMPAKYHDICDTCVRQPTCQSDCFLQQDEQKPAWSEEDEEMLVGCVQAMCTPDAYSLNDRINFEFWLKSLKDRVQPQSKQEWSKEDRRHIEKLILNVNAKEFPDEVDWLISLHEKIAPPYWDKEDEEMLNQAIQEVEYALNDKNIAFSGREPVLLWLKHLRPQLQWKPSEEQMDALRYVTNFDYGGHKATLVSLYEQLKKLREG